MTGAVELQKGVFNVLDGDATISGLVRGIYDNPQQVANPDDNSEYPYITVSDVTATAWDTDTEQGTDADVTIHVWSRASHALEAKEIQDAIYSALHRGTIVISGYAFIACDLVNQQIERDPDGYTRHGIQDFRIVYEEQ